MGAARGLLKYAKDEPFFVFVGEGGVTTCYESDQARFNRLYWHDYVDYVGKYTKQSNEKLMDEDIKNACGDFN